MACVFACVHTHLMVMIPEANADGAAGSGQDSCHSVEVDQHICYSLQNELLVHNGLTTSGNKNKDTSVIHHFFNSISSLSGILINSLLNSF